MFDYKQIPVDHLLLDPRNPRFAHDLPNSVPEGKSIEELQGWTLKHFQLDSDNGDDESGTEIDDLYHSILNVGYIPIDRIVVENIGRDSYLVIEGNRRVATVKTILARYKEGHRSIKKDIKKKGSPFEEKVLPSLEKINCLILKTDGISKEEIKNRKETILGIRHHGSLLEWKPVARAHNIFSEYMGILSVPVDDLEGFRFEKNIVREIAQRLSIKQNEVKKALQSYIPYLQLINEEENVQPDHYSLIENAATNKKLRASYFSLFGEVSMWESESLDKLASICQFGERDRLPTPTKKKIIERPQQFSRLSKLVEARESNPSTAIRDAARIIIAAVEDEEDLEMTLDLGVDHIRALEIQTNWLESFNNLLAKTNDELSIHDYRGGNEEMRKEELKVPVCNLARLARIEQPSFCPNY